LPGTTYTVADRADFDLLAEVIADHHPRLAEAGVTTQLLVANAEEGKSPLKNRGYPCLALARIVSLKDRVAGLKDTVIYLDGARWAEKSEEEQRAVLDHELSHFELVLDKQKKVKLDAADRPKLRTRLHDHEIGVFFDVVERHGVSAIEAQSYRDLHRKMVQMTFDWS
jgi:hypothetical protein